MDLLAFRSLQEDARHNPVAEQNQDERPGNFAKKR